MMEVDGGEQPHPRDVVERRVASGIIPREEVDFARSYRLGHLTAPIQMPNGEEATLSDADFEHLILDARIRRKPHRIRHLLEHVYAMYNARTERRMAVSEWIEGEIRLHGYAILDADGGVRTLHIVRVQELERLKRRSEPIWIRNQ